MWSLHANVMESENWSTIVSPWREGLVHGTKEISVGEKGHSLLVMPYLGALWKTEITEGSDTHQATHQYKYFL